MADTSDPSQPSEPSQPSHNHIESEGSEETSDQIPPQVSVWCGASGQQCKCVSCVCSVCWEQVRWRDDHRMYSYIQGNCLGLGEDGKGRGRQCRGDLSVLWIKWGPLGVSSHPCDALTRCEASPFSSFCDEFAKFQWFSSFGNKHLS